MSRMRWSAIMILLTAMIAWSGCQTVQTSLMNGEAEAPPLSEAPLPNYTVGEYFTFDDGTTAMVRAISGEHVTWRYSNGAVSKRYRNFIIPALTWTSANRQGEARTTAVFDLLWPLAVGKKGQYDSQQVISTRDGTESTEFSRTWYCTIEGTERVGVPAGTFDTYVIACNRYSDISRKWRATRRYYYAPDLGHYVLREDRHRSRPNKSRALLSYGFNSTVLPKKDQLKLNQRLQQILSNNADGIAGNWTSRKGDVTATLIPIQSFTGANNDECREYHSVYSVKGRIRKNVRKVCRQPDGRWQRIE